ncbi:hypothetical protein C4A75_15240 [Brevibacillus laterosporus]|nr:hypothetical protein C4A75_15240 [Brevibacillus laterosporus]
MSNKDMHDRLNEHINLSEEYLMGTILRKLRVGALFFVIPNKTTLFQMHMEIRLQKTNLCLL